MTDSTAQVHYEAADGIAVLTLDDQPARNALSTAIRTGIWTGFERAEADPEVKVIIITGAGEKAFCAGIHLKEMAVAQTRIPPPDFMPIPRRTVEVSKPIIAALNGVAFGGGFLLAQSADLVIAADHVKMGMPEVKVGRGAPWSAPLSRMIPRRVWLQMALTGEPITAQRGYEIGFVNELVPLAELMPRARAMAETIRDNAPLTVQASLEMAHLTDNFGLTEAWDKTDRAFDKVYLSEDAQEGPRAFKEGRAPVWQGR